MVKCIVCSDKTHYKIILFKTVESTNLNDAIHQFKKGNINGLQIVKSDNYKKPGNPEKPENRGIVHDLGICRTCYVDIKSKDHKYSWLYKKIRYWKKRKLFILEQFPEWHAYRKPEYNYWIRTSTDEMTELLKSPKMRWLSEKGFNVWSTNIIGLKGFTIHCEHNEDEPMPELNISEDNQFDYDDDLYKCDTCKIIYESWMFINCDHDLEKITE